MTKQEYYDLLVKSTTDGTFPSRREGMCYYRHPDGRKCAVGILIDDADYVPRFENVPVIGLPDELLTKITPDGMHVGHLHQIQRLHDRAATRLDWWRPGYLIEDLNGLPVFDDVKKQEAVCSSL